jgi:hypothetical protein
MTQSLTRSTFLSILMLLCLQAVPLAAAGSTAEAGKGLPRFEPVDQCVAEPPADLELDFTIDCGQVVVPEFHQEGGSRELKLGITRFSSGRGTAATSLLALLMLGVGFIGTRRWT